VLGTRSALEWVVDQYHCETDLHTGVTSDPNDPADEQFIVRLIGRVTTVSLLMEWPESKKEPTKYFLCDLPVSYTLRRLVRLAKCRWKIEQDYQQLKEELGLDHYEGRSWIGWHHHTTWS
jgi:SRSO17 transposase